MASKANRMSRVQLQEQNRLLRRQNIKDGWIGLLTTAVRWGFASFMVYHICLSVIALAGKETQASFLMNMILNIQVSRWAPWIVAAICGGISVRQASLRKRTVAHLQGRVRDLEQRIDPNRTSSELTIHGDTNPGDA